MCREQRASWARQSSCEPLVARARSRAVSDWSRPIAVYEQKSKESDMVSVSCLIVP